MSSDMSAPATQRAEMAEIMVKAVFQKEGDGADWPAFCAKWECTVEEFRTMMCTALAALEAHGYTIVGSQP